MLVGPISHHGSKVYTKLALSLKIINITITASNKVVNDKLEDNQHDKIAGEAKPLA